MIFFVSLQVQRLMMTMAVLAVGNDATEFPDLQAIQVEQAQWIVLIVNTPLPGEPDTRRARERRLAPDQ